MHSFNSDGYEGEMKTLLTENMGKKSEDNKWKYVDIYIPVPLLEVVFKTIFNVTVLLFIFANKNVINVIFLQTFLKVNL